MALFFLLSFCPNNAAGLFDPSWCAIPSVGEENYGWVPVRSAAAVTFYIYKNTKITNLLVRARARAPKK
jgi:hypothetical protein